MEQPGKAKTRFDLVSGGFGKITGGLVNLILGGIVVFFHREAGLSLLALGVILISLGGWGILWGAKAPQKEIACPHCGATNALLAEVKDFACQQCEQPLKLVRK